MNRRRRRIRWLLLAALATGFLFQLVVERRAQPFASDSFHYLLLAKSLAAGDGFVSGGSQHPDTTWLPIYPMMIAAAYVFVRNLDWAALIVTAAGGAVSLLPFALLVRSMFGRKALVPAIAIGSLSCVVAVAWRLLPEAVYLPISLAAVASTWWSVRRPGRAVSLTAGLIAGLAALTRAEGLAWVLFTPAWSFLDGGPSRSGGPGRWSRAAFALLGAGTLYAGYVAWASARLGRFEPFPEVHYLRLIREVDDRFGLRYTSGPRMAWSDRARFLLTEDQSAFVLESSFASGSVPTPQSAFVVPEKATFGAKVPLSSSANRRLTITLTNLRRVPTALQELHLVPPVLLVLGAIGVLGSLVTRRGRRRMLFLAAAFAATLLPVVSHVEGRFLFPAFAIGLVPAAAGWAWLVSAARRAWPRSKVPAYVLSGLIALAVAAAGATHLRPQTERVEKALMRRDAAKWARTHLGPGPVLALEPGVPFWSEHPYRAIPMGGPDAVLAYARAQKAAALSFEDPNDLERLPLLAPFSSDPPPPGFRLVHQRVRRGVGRIRFFAIEPAP